MANIKKKLQVQKIREVKRKPLRKAKVDGLDPEVEEHARQLLRTIGNLRLEKIDLTTRESAKESLVELDKMFEKLTSLKRASVAIRRFLEEED